MIKNVLKSFSKLDVGLTFYIQGIQSQGFVLFSFPIKALIGKTRQESRVKKVVIKEKE